MSGIENISGSHLNDSIKGSNDRNRLNGEDGEDLIDGRGGDDDLYGMYGVDDITGGTGRDRFSYDDLGDTGVGAGNRDLIRDFKKTELDQISLKDIFDANTSVGGQQDFRFIGTSAFTGGGQVRYVKVDLEGTANDRTIIQISTDTDTAVEMEIELFGLVTLATTDFIFS